MSSIRFAALALGAVCAAVAADAPLPELRTEPTNGGSIFHVRNTGSAPLNAYFIELVDYPGSSFYFWQDDASNPIAPGATRDIPTTNMTVGAVPDQVKLQAAIYAGGATAGAPEKVALLQGRHRTLLETTRELIRRLEKAGSADAAKADLTQWQGSMPALTRSNRYTAAGINQAAASGLIADALKRLSSEAPAAVVTRLREVESQLSK